MQKVIPSSLKQNVFWINRILSSVVNVARPQGSILTLVIMINYQGHPMGPSVGQKKKKNEHLKRS